MDELDPDDLDDAEATATPEGESVDAPTESASVDTIARDLEQAAPNATGATVEAPGAPAPPAPAVPSAASVFGASPSAGAARASSSGAKDRYGRPFDPALHKTNPDGSPSLDPRGRIRIKPGRPAAPKPGAQPPKRAPQASPPSSSMPPLPGGIPVAAGPSSGAIGAAALTVTTLHGGLSMILGAEEWRPTAEETPVLVSAWATYFDSLGVTDLPPGFALVACYAMFIASSPVRMAQVYALAKAGAAKAGLGGGRPSEAQGQPSASTAGA